MATSATAAISGVARDDLGLDPSTIDSTIRRRTAWDRVRRLVPRSRHDRTDALAQLMQFASRKRAEPRDNESAAAQSAEPADLREHAMWAEKRRGAAHGSSLKRTNVDAVTDNSARLRRRIRERIAK